MTGRILWPALKIVGVSAPLIWFWMEWGGRAYARLFAQIAIPIYGWLGQTDILPNAYRDRFVSYVPFLILMIVTPRVSWMRRIVGISIGFVVIFAIQVAYIYVHTIATSFRLDGAMTALGLEIIFPMMLLSDSAPFILWAIICHDFVREKTAKLFAVAGAPETKPALEADLEQEGRPDLQSDLQPDLQPKSPGERRG
jgi:hypothetical protein